MSLPRSEDLPVGVGLGPSTRLDAAAVQRVLDAAAVLQVRRSEAAALAAGERLTEGQVVARGVAGIHEWLHTTSAAWRENLSVRPSASTTQLRAGLPANRAFVESGARMVSVFDYYGLDTDARLLLANERVGDYLFARAPVQMKIIDRALVLLDGPIFDGSVSVMAIHAGPCLEAAWRYWDAVVASAVPVEDAGISDLGVLSKRQRQVVALMASDLGDEAIAASLGVSVRTVRSEVAAVLAALGVKSRFAAGVRVQMWGHS
ncbi:helix-turn-helix transcriptional regulator [Nocardioides conyzicola]|uniref:HTH luxR-type domain-containing protein n=1 Tax=Nocardioides conyzicola TaxID=1651781 RepID=A0ABP8XFL0_9ACTN